MIKTFVDGNQCDELFTLSRFPGGEPHAKLNRQYANIGDRIDIVLKGADLNEYAQAKMMQNLLAQFNVKPHFFIPYLAGLRADKDPTVGWKAYLPIVDQLNDVTIVDPHSRVYKEAGLGARVIHAMDITRQNITQQYDFVIAPDPGAETRARSSAQNLKSAIKPEMIYMNKVRDQDSGRIISYGMSPVSEHLVGSLEDKTALVVDDICDGGMTFKLLAEALQNKGLARLDLYVTHGVFSGDAENNLTPYDNIYTTNSLETATRIDRAIIFDIERQYLEHSGTIPN